jgi:serine/threonine-protein kinase
MGTTAVKKIGPYTLHHILNAGTLGSLWLADSYLHTINRKVVVKIVDDGLRSLDAIVQWAKVWVQASAEPNVIPLVEVGVYDQQLVIVTDYLPNGSLEDNLKRNGEQPLAPEMATAIMLDILAGLTAVHPRRIIYRNLHPSKILFSGQTARLLLPSLAHVIEPDEVSSYPGSSFPQTIPYFSPEALGGNYSEQADLWSAGVILYRMLIGRLPFPLTSLSSCIKGILESDPPLLLTLPGRLWEFLLKSLEKDPRKRFQSAAEMRAALITVKLAAPTVPGPMSADQRAMTITLTRTHITEPDPTISEETEVRSPLVAGRILQDRYEIISMVGRGGMGCVYRARHLVLGNTLALKENLISNISEKFLHLFKQEGMLLAHLYHPQLPRVQDFFIEDGRSFFVMDFIEGQSLERLLSQSGNALPEDKIIDIAVNVCRVLEYLHNQKPPIVHCDIKPHNLLITPEGVVKLLDLGIARLMTETSADDGQLALTPPFAAPEQWEGRAGPRSDIFSLGATMYNLLTGKTIRTGYEPLAFLHAPPLRSLNPAASQGLDELISKCLREHEQDRWQTARELREALETLRSGGDHRPGPPLPPPMPRDEYDVFISYRRQNGATEARVIRAELRQQNLRVFLDVDDLGAGHFDQALLGRIAVTPNFIVVLSPNCLDRCADERDWLRQEIAKAIQTNRKIVPVMLPGFQFPEPQTLPEELRPISAHQSVPYSHEYFDAMIAKIARYLRQSR